MRPGSGSGFRRPPTPTRPAESIPRPPQRVLRSASSGTQRSRLSRPSSAPSLRRTSPSRRIAALEEELRREQVRATLLADELKASLRR
eukprot:CAMPEP_0204360062 /NCGR_PEP_ID=MMETSP0469-20131031/37746_1 /ASSEMBLY_ACC=CAM_ASM_000384 /TAXON_ID=2969 /ORGANISM="Oxyrrhis marina" /LENGTH=87 /DNA_ID=CAMNT_0051348211 /DNA_START=114 /DNA_END=374 /DNA_ORIENTATION=+